MSEPVLEPARRDPWWRLRVPLGPLALAYLLILAVAIFGAWQSHQQDVERCRDSRDARMVLRQLVELTDDGGGQALPLTKVPGYADLDPEMQTYLANLEAALAPPPAGEDRPPSQFVARALTLLPLPDCEALG